MASYRVIISYSTDNYFFLGADHVIMLHMSQINYRRHHSLSWNPIRSFVAHADTGWTDHVIIAKSWDIITQQGEK